MLKVNFLHVTLDGASTGVLKFVVETVASVKLDIYAMFAFRTSILLGAIMAIGFIDKSLL